MKKKILWMVLVIAAVACGGWLWLSSLYVTPVLMYHNVKPDAEGLANTVSEDVFAWQMDYLEKHGFHILTLDEYTQAALKRKWPRKSVLLTFDDGYLDTYQYAFPILKEHKFPWVLFVPSDFIGARKGHLNADQIREMLTEGMTLASHSCKHKYLPQESAEVVHREIALSKTKLEEMFQTDISVFSYPLGGFTPEAQKEVAKAGYLLGFTTNRGRLDNSDYLALTRIKVSTKNKGISFAAKLSGYYNFFRKPKPPAAELKDTPNTLDSTETQE